MIEELGKEYSAASTHQQKENGVNTNTVFYKVVALRAHPISSDHHAFPHQKLIKQCLFPDLYPNLTHDLSCLSVCFEQLLAFLALFLDRVVLVQ